ncbi:hypothetical protein [Pseudomonas sp. DTU12.1]|uniref:hypothetical protein n=1 Tax=Pseudomonas sp. DTU12.1 TaxID=2654238 RepID=UPI00132EF947|nr:hypothetical protein [Pseudomonas sp. DTU12.1]QHG23876.1 hypothetical protein GDV60_13795 [Pseudomonas sp. DTU12.1]
MISINSHLSTMHTDIPKFLDDIVEEMWADLNPVNKVGDPIKHALISKVGNLKEKVSSQEHMKQVGGDAQARHLEYVQLLEDSTYLKHIITARPTQLNSITVTAQEILQEDDLFVMHRGKAQSRPFGKLLLKAFNYVSYRGSDHCYMRYQKLLFKEATCPYCNYGTATIIKVEKPAGASKIMMLYDIDHFYPKHAFPYLALSFYNHIPSCKICNQTLKEGKIFRTNTHIHPYQLCFDSIYRFEANHSILKSHPLEKINLVNVSSFQDQLASNLCLEDRYNCSTKLARTEDLIDILSKRLHLLDDPTCAPAEFKALIELIKAFGVVQKKERILSSPYGKYNRDIVKMFDVKNVLNIS